MLDNFPAIRPSLNLDFGALRSLDPRITFTRASGATYFDQFGLLRTALNDEPRFDHNPATLESLGLLIEEQRTNVLLHNRDLSNAAWTKTNVTAARNQIGIDGASNTATRLTASANDATVLQAVTSASAARATSAYVRRVTGGGAIEMTQDGGATWTAITVPTTWGRVAIPSATVTNPSVGFRFATNGDAIDVDYVQCEGGAFATSAIATTTASVTRSADLASMTGANFSSWYRADEGTLFAEFAPGGSSTSDECALSISDGTSSNLIGFLWSGANIRVGAQVFAGGSSQLIGIAEATGSTPRNTPRRMAIAIRQNDVSAAFGGAATPADTSVTIPAVNRLVIGATGSGTSRFVNGPVSRVAYYPRRLPSATLQAITA